MAPRTFVLTYLAIVVFLLCGISHLVCAQDITIEMRPLIESNTGPYDQGSEVILVCEITGTTSYNNVIITRTIAPVTTTLIENNAVHSAAPSNIEYVGTTNFDTINSQTSPVFKITNLTPADIGFITCNVQRDAINIGSGSLYFEVNYVPVPTCVTLSDPHNPIYTIGDVVTYQCSSMLGVPTASLVWGTGDVVFSLPIETTTFTSDSITSQLTLTIQDSHNGAVLRCVTISSGVAESCEFGPFTVLSADMTTNVMTAVDVVTTHSQVDRRTSPTDTTRDDSSSVVTMLTTAPSGGGSLSSSAVAAICVLFVVIVIAGVTIVVFVHTRRCGTLGKKNDPSRKTGLAQNGTTATSLDDQAYYNVAQDSTSVRPHVEAPSSGVLYAVVDRRKSERYPPNAAAAADNGEIPNNNYENNVISASALTTPRSIDDTVVTVDGTLSSEDGGAIPETRPSSANLVQNGVSSPDDSNVMYESVASGDITQDTTISTQEDDTRESSSPTKDLNAEGLLYADIELRRPPTGNRDTIISTDEATIYASISVTKT